MKKSFIAFCFLFIFSEQNAFSQLLQLWGTTNQGGKDETGVIFKVNNDGSGYAVVHYCNVNTGFSPMGSLLVIGKSMYGMMQYGGAHDSGTIFKFNPADNSVTDIFDFNRPSGGFPLGNLILGKDGKLYGMTSVGGDSTRGTIFNFDLSDNTLTVLHDFNWTFGAYPQGSLVQAGNGKLYGMTIDGGAGGIGMIFSYDPVQKIYTDLLDFDITNGAAPRGSLMQANDGNLYGMAFEGNGSMWGLIFSIDTATGSFTQLYDFELATGAVPHGSLIQGTNGKLYGMTNAGGPDNFGTLFSYSIRDKKFTDLHNFTSVDGINPVGSLLLGSDGKLYGLSPSKNDSIFGAMFSFDPADSTFSDLFDFRLKTGADPFGDLIEYDLPTGINPVVEDIFTLCPNPSNGKITISSPFSINDVEIMNELGQRIFSQKFYTKKFMPDLGRLNKGIYFIRLNGNGEVGVKKIVIQ